MNRARTNQAVESLERLSPRRRQILRALAQGQTAGETAAALGVTKHYVESERVITYRILGVRNHVEALRVALAARIG